MKSKNPNMTDAERSARREAHEAEEALLDKFGHEQAIAINKLTADLKQSAREMGDAEANYLVRNYRALQRERMRYSNQLNAIAKRDKELGRPETPYRTLEYFFKQYRALESQLRTTLQYFVEDHPVGAWLISIPGMGPVTSASLLSCIDIRQCPTAGNLWSYAGLISGTAWIGGEKAKKAVLQFVDGSRPIDSADIADIANYVGCDARWLGRRVVKASTLRPTPFHNWDVEEDDEDYIDRLFEATEEELKQNVSAEASPDASPEELVPGLNLTLEHVVDALSRRPWNAQLKQTCWMIGKNFVRCGSGFYNEQYKQRKMDEALANEKGVFRHIAEEQLQGVKKGTTAETAYKEGKLPAGQLHNRAVKFALRLFLSHLHEVWYRIEYKKLPPVPYAIEHLGHKDYIEPPNLKVVMHRFV